MKSAATVMIEEASLPNEVNECYFACGYDIMERFEVHEAQPALFFEEKHQHAVESCSLFQHQ